MENQNEFTIIEKIDQNDVANYNIFLLSQKSSIRFNSIFLGVVALGLGLYSLIYEIVTTKTLTPTTGIISGVLLLLGLFSLIFMIPVVKRMIKKRVKTTDSDIPLIFVKLDDEGITYRLANPEKEMEDPTPISWEKVIKAVDKEDMIYIQIEKSFVLIKKNDCKAPTQLVNFLQEKLSNRYKITKK